MDAKIWVLLALSTVVNSRDLIVGSNNSGHKIYEENKKANPAIWRQTENVTIAAADNEVISKLIVTDIRDEKDGDVKIVEGGEGQRNVTIELKSPTVLRGYEFHIEAYAISNNGQTSGLENGDTQKALNKDETNMNTSPKTSITPQILSSTSENPLSSLGINESKLKRQNREVENKDKSIQEPIHPLGDVSTTTKASHLQSTVTPNGSENGEDKERKFPTSYGVHEHDNINQPSIHIQETSKISESTARYIPSTEFKAMEVNHNHHESTSTKNDMMRNSSDDYPKFYIHEINTAAPINNKDLNIAENTTKTESFRQKRDVVDVQQKPGVNVKENTDKIKNEDAKRTTETNDSNNQEQNPLQKNTATSDLRHVRNNQNFGHPHHHHVHEDTKHLDEEQNRQHAFRGRHIPQRFGFNGANRSTGHDDSSADISKTSTLLPTNAETKILTDQNEKSSQTNTMSVPKFITNESTTIKAEITIANKHVADNTDKLNEPVTIKENERPKRDIESSSLSTSTLQPNNNKNAAVIDKNADAPTKLEIPVEIPSAKNTDKKDNLKTVVEGNKNSERNTRDSVVDSKKKNEEPQYLPNSSTTTKPENKNGQIGNAPITEKLKNIQEPIGRKSKAKTSVTENVTEPKKRISRDTNTVKKFDREANEKVSTSTEVAKEAEIEKEAKKIDEKFENKFPIPVMIGIKDQKQDPITAAGTNKSTPYFQGDSKNGTVSPRDGTTNAPVKDQSPKNQRESRKADLKDTKASLDINKEEITLSSDLTKDIADITLLKKANVNI